MNGKWHENVVGFEVYKAVTLKNASPAMWRREGPVKTEISEGRVASAV
jgi:hypothetical protein